MVQLPAENSILAAAVRRAADEHRLSHAVILTGRGDLTAAARFLAAAHVCEGEHKALPDLPPLPQGAGGRTPGRDLRAGHGAQGADGGGRPCAAQGRVHPSQRGGAEGVYHRRLPPAERAGSERAAEDRARRGRPTPRSSSAPIPLPRCWRRSAPAASC